MIVLLLLSSLLNIISPALPPHDVHLSKSVIEYSPKDEALQITLHIFLDDLEATLINHGAPKKLNLCTKKEHEEGEDWMKKYLRASFRIMVNGEEKEYKYIGKEISEDFLATWVYLEVKDIKTIENIGVKSTILMELYDDQKNIVQIKVPEQKPKFLMFDRTYTEEFVIY